VFADVPGEQAALDVGRPAGREVDQDGEALVPVEGIVGVGAGDDGESQRTAKEQAAHTQACQGD